MRHFLDVHAALGRHDEGDARRLAIDEHRKVKLARDRRAVLDIKTVHLLAGRAGLHGDERVAEHLLGEALHLLDRFGEPHAALVARGGFLEPALAAPARVNLALHDEERSAELLCGSFRLLGGEGRLAARHRHAEFPEHRLGLVFMDVHGRIPAGVRWTRSSRTRFLAQFLASRLNARLLRYRGALPCGSLVLHPFKAALMPWQASMRLFTEATDFSNIAFSSLFSSISTTRSTPAAPMTTGTPRNKPFCPYCPSR